MITVNRCIEVAPGIFRKKVFRWDALVIFPILLFLSVSCANPSELDHSLSLEEYQDLGMPDYSRIWSFEDYRDACNILEYMKVSDPLTLPKKESRKSGKYFDRIVDPDNMSFFMDETIPLYERAYQIQPYVDILGYLTRLYTDLNHTEQYYSRELIELYIFGLFITENMMDLGHQINESVAEEDIIMQSGFPSIQDVYITMVIFLLENQKRLSLFETEDLEKLSYYLYNSVLNNISWIDASPAEEIKQHLQEVLDSTTSDHINERYRMLIEQL